MPLHSMKAQTDTDCWELLGARQVGQEIYGEACSAVDVI